jgi:hypothetical protein
MRKLKICGIVFFLVGSLSLCEAQDVLSVVEGTVKKADAFTRTIAVETSEGADYSFRYVGWTVVYGAEGIGQATIHGVSKIGEGAKLVVHYTVAGGKDKCRNSTAWAATAPRPPRGPSASLIGAEKN